MRSDAVGSGLQCTHKIQFNWTGHGQTECFVDENRPDVVTTMLDLGGIIEFMANLGNPK